MSRILIGYSTCPITVSLLRAKGHEAFTCDLRSANHPWHIQGDIWSVVHRSWDWAIFHPTCTYLTVSAAWAYADPDYDRYPGVGYHQQVQPGTLTGAPRREARRQAIADVRKLAALPYRKAIENPARSFLARAVRSPDQVIHPYQFGDDASKATGLWLDRMPRLVPTCRVPGRIVQANGKPVERWSNQTDSGQNRLTPSNDRWLKRSITYPGIAEAFAEQWV